jgi:NADPH:quinone reductase-like Zn-dependent oxidoreductase
MRAVVYSEYGGPEVLRLSALPKPAPKPDEILIGVRAAPVQFGDLMARNFAAVSSSGFSMPAAFWLMARLTFGWRKPRQGVLGSAFSGEVEAVGAAVRRFAVGDAVFGYRGQQMGAYAESLCMREDGLVTHKPASLTHEEACVVPYGALTALSLLRKVGVRAGDHVLINGASGGIGAYALQLAKAHFGARVTGVCATPRVETVRALGADQMIDYTREDFAAGEARYDLVMDIIRKSSFARARRVLKPDGRYLLVSFKMRQVQQMLWTRLRGGQRVICALSNETRADLELIRDLMAAGALRAVIDRCYPLEAAIRRVLDDPALAERLARAGRARYADFSWATTVAETLAALTGD